MSMVKGGSADALRGGILENWKLAGLGALVQKGVLHEAELLNT
jgi:hypothetical protein